MTTPSVHFSDNVPMDNLNANTDHGSKATRGQVTRSCQWLPSYRLRLRPLIILFHPVNWFHFKLATPTPLLHPWHFPSSGLYSLVPRGTFKLLSSSPRLVSFPRPAFVPWSISTPLTLYLSPPPAILLYVRLRYCSHVFEDPLVTHPEVRKSKSFSLILVHILLLVTSLLARRRSRPLRFCASASPSSHPSPTTSDCRFRIGTQHRDHFGLKI
ncbi:hypothetical protein EDB92DRAFT_883734 [Lactarius akahatsu]|uniref:Uncharacterized protein n=1 Tax=Lactarius akahatsu TaxID=416441 RepID=A0AAD4LJ83_9AGAM|nr:hypothetical protein EDB92DRAFT_883734 [Lactarius akahatsu]